MQKEVKKSWALFIGIGTMMIAHGLQMQIMGIRSVLEDFSVFTTGVFMSGYYIGYFVGLEQLQILYLRLVTSECLQLLHPLHHLVHCLQ